MPDPKKDQTWLQNLVKNERPARMIGLFTGHQMKPHDVERLTNACLTAMREEDQGASLTLSPVGDPSPKELELQKSDTRFWKGWIRFASSSFPLAIVR